MYKVIGFRKSDYVNKSGKNIHGTHLYVVSDTPREGVIGYECDRLWLPGHSAYQPAVNDVIRIYYNKFGSIEEVIPEK